MKGMSSEGSFGAWKDLIQAIEEQSGEKRQHLGPIEGRRGSPSSLEMAYNRGTKLVIGRVGSLKEGPRGFREALESLGGNGTSKQVIEWIEAHPEELANLREAKLNWPFA